MNPHVQLFEDGGSGYEKSQVSIKWMLFETLHQIVSSDSLPIFFYLVILAVESLQIFYFYMHPYVSAL